MLTLTHQLIFNVTRVNLNFNLDNYFRCLRELDKHYRQNFI
jgi:hypothetical protein